MLKKGQAGYLAAKEKILNVTKERSIKRRKEFSKQCLYCGNDIPYEKRRSKFCNHSCAASYNNKGTVRNGNPIDNVFCLNCQNPISRRQKYCCKNCQQEYEYKQYINKWLSGKVSGNTSKQVTVSQYVRRYLFEKYNSQCCKCGWSEINPVTGKVPLTISHIDGNPYHTVEENLELICPNCHSLTPTYGALNKGNGRKHRYNAVVA